MPENEFDFEDAMELDGISPDAEGDKMKKYLAGNFSGKGEGGGGNSFEQA